MKRKGKQKNGLKKTLKKKEEKKEVLQPKKLVEEVKVEPIIDDRPKLKKNRFDNSENLTKNFDSHEFYCKCGECNKQIINVELANKLQLLRNAIRKPIVINCAYRCESHNKAVGGVEHSQHLLGNAADIRTSGMDQDHVVEEAVKLGFTGIGRYNSFLHLDLRLGNKAKWDKRSK